MENNQQNKTRSLVQTGFFYGWIIVAILVILQMVMFGPRGSFGVFIKPLTSEFDWSRALVSGAFSLSSLVQGASSIVMGWLNDRLGPRKVLTICGILVGTGLMLMYTVNSAWQLYLFYTTLIGLGMGGLYSPQMSTVARWFVKRRNLMTGLLMAGGGIGGLLGPLLITWLVYSYGWRDSYLFIGLGVLIIIIVGSQFLKRNPAQIGRVPYGDVQQKEGKVSSLPAGLSIRETLRTGRYWIFAFIIFAFGYCFSTVLVHIVPHAIDRGISATSAATILSAMNGAMTTGSILVGLIADRIGGRRAFFTCFCLLGVVAFLLLPIDSPWLLGLIVVIMALGSGGTAVIESTMVADLFGMKSHGSILGTIVFTFTLGAATGPFIAGSIFDNTGSYQWAFSICSILIFLAVVMAFLLQRLYEPVTLKSK